MKPLCRLGGLVHKPRELAKSVICARPGGDEGASQTVGGHLLVVCEPTKTVVKSFGFCPLTGGGEVLPVRSFLSVLFKRNEPALAIVSSGPVGGHGNIGPGRVRGLFIIGVQPSKGIRMFSRLTWSHGRPWFGFPGCGSLCHVCPTLRPPKKRSFPRRPWPWRCAVRRSF